MREVAVSLTGCKHGSAADRGGIMEARIGDHAGRIDLHMIATHAKRLRRQPRHYAVIITGGVGKSSG
jgi:hypothetical protein